MGKRILKDKSFDFAVRVIRICQQLADGRREFVLSKQLLRSGTSIGALVREAQNGESKKDFVHKLGIAQKECDETLYWLELLKETGYISPANFNALYDQCNELLRMLRSSIMTAKKSSILPHFLLHLISYIL